MNIWQFAADNPVTSIILAVLALLAWQVVFNTIFLIFNRRQRTRNIETKGWPPAHLDADGDFKPEKNEE